MASEPASILAAAAINGVCGLWAGGPVGAAAGASAGALTGLAQLLLTRRGATDQKRYRQAFAATAEAVDQWVASEGLDDATKARLLANAGEIFDRHRLTASDLIGTKLDAAGAAARVRELARPAGRWPDEDDRLLGQVVEAAYSALLAQGSDLQGLEQGFRVAVLKGQDEAATKLDGLPSEVVKALRRSEAAGLLRDPTLAWDSSIDAPSALLTANRRIVPFDGRDDLMARIETWCLEPPDLAVALFTGPGGTGKTRLLIEACSRLRPHGWHAGFLDTDLDRLLDRLEALLDDPRPLFIAIDYAETRRPEVGEVIGQARHRLGQRAAPVRLVLLARAQGDWWALLQREGGTVAEVLKGPAVWVETVAPLAASAEQRPVLFDRALGAFAQAKGFAGPAIDAPDLSGDDFATVLFIHMAALARLDGKRDLQTAEDFLDHTADREQRFWDDAAKTEGYAKLADWPIAQAAVLTTLAGGAQAAEDARAIVGRAPLVERCQPAAIEKICAILNRTYPGERYVEGILPDLLGEHLTARVTAHDESVVDAAVASDAGTPASRHALTVLTRIAARTSGARAWLERALAPNLERLSETAVAVAVETGDPIGQVLAEALSQGADFDLARHLDKHMPYPTIALRETAVVLTEIQLATLESDAPHDKTNAERARQSGNLAVRLAGLGQREDALEAAQQAVELYRDLANSRPDAIGPYLAASLNNLANMLSDLGRREDALEAARQAVELYRKLAEARPDPFRPYMAGSLNNLASMLSDLGRREDALEAAQQALDVRRELAEAEPDTFRPDLASSLNNLANRLSDLGRPEDALKVAQQAVELYRDLAVARPDAFQPDLATSLNNLANRLGNLGRREDALDAAQQAVDIRRDLAVARPDAFRPDLATSLNNLANRLSDLGRHEDALEAAQRAVELYRDLAVARPDAFRPDLATSLNNLANRLGNLGRREGALKAAQQAVELYREMAEARPDAFRPYLAMSLNNLANKLSDLGRRGDALGAAQQAVDLYRDLAVARHDAFRPGLARSLGTLALCLSATARHEEALQSMGDGVATLSPLFLHSPGAFVGLMATLCRHYVELAEAREVEPDSELLGPIVEAFDSIRRADGDDEDPRRDQPTR